MKRIAQIISWLSLIAIVLLAVLFFADRISLGLMQNLMLLASIAWFASAAVWMEHGLD